MEETRLAPPLASCELQKDPDEVAQVTVRALFAQTPKPRYVVTPNQQEAGETIRTVPVGVALLNADHPYSYSLEALTTMLQEAMAAR